MRDVEQLAVDLAAWLLRRNYVMRQAMAGGMGSLRVLDNGRFVVSINNDRGLLSVKLGRLPAPREEDQPSMVYWALYLGLRPAYAELPLERVLDDEERLTWAREEMASTQAAVEAIETMPAVRLGEVETCARAKQEEFWKGLGLWPLPQGHEPIRLRKKDE